MFKFYPNFINILNLISNLLYAKHIYFMPNFTLCQTSKWSMKCKPVIQGIDFTTQTEPQPVTVVFTRLLWPISCYSFCAKDFSVGCFLYFSHQLSSLFFPFVILGRLVKRDTKNDTPPVPTWGHLSIIGSNSSQGYTFHHSIKHPLECPDATVTVELYAL